MLYGLTAQQDISAKKFNQHFFQLQHCQVAEPWRRSLLPKFAIQILPAALLCFLNRDTKLRFFPKRGSALQLPSEGFSFPVDTLSHRRSCTRHGWEIPRASARQAGFGTAGFAERRRSSSTDSLRDQETLEPRTAKADFWWDGGFHAWKRLAESGKQFTSRGQGRGVGVAPTGVSASNWLGTALCRPSGETWGGSREGRGASVAPSRAAESARPWLSSLARFFLRFGMGQATFLSFWLLARSLRKLTGRAVRKGTAGTQSELLLS